MGKKEVITNKLVDEIKEGYIIYDFENEQYLDEDFDDVRDFSGAYIYDSFDDVKKAFLEDADQDIDCIYQVRQTFEILKKFERKVTFEEVKE